MRSDFSVNNKNEYRMLMDLNGFPDVSTVKVSSITNIGEKLTKYTPSMTTILPLLSFTNDL